MPVDGWYCADCGEVFPERYYSKGDFHCNSVTLEPVTAVLFERKVAE